MTISHLAHTTSFVPIARRVSKGVLRSVMGSEKNSPIHLRPAKIRPFSSLFVNLVLDEIALHGPRPCDMGRGFIHWPATL